MNGAHQCGDPANVVAPLIINFNVSGLTGEIQNVDLSLTLTH